MRKLLLAIFVFGALPGFAQKAFEGTWRVNVQSGEFKGHDRYALQDGVWHCYTCVPEMSVKADGGPHEVTGSPYYDTATVREVNDHTVEIMTEKNGKPAELTLDGGHWYIEDLQSANGTHVAPAGGPLPDHSIPTGQRTLLGEDDRVYVGAWTRIVVRRATADEQGS